MTANPLLDQLHAAAEDAERRLHAVADKAGLRSKYGAPGAWLKQRAMAFDFANALGQIRTCSHVSHSPEPVFQVAHRPLEVFCIRCATAAGEAVGGTPEDLLCDVCRQAGRKLHGGLVAVGPLLLMFGACRPCFPRVVGQVAA